ncbi:MAG: hypothetical protein NTX89_02165 [Candidatus Omnitrophica bacterium]|nr:hypothetical protein [Candidatus Omnitrophota bacterium]
MNNTNELNQNLCFHGFQKDKACFFCAQSEVYFQRDIEVYEGMYTKTSNLSFGLAFELAQRIKLWKEATKNINLRDYFQAIKKSQKILWSENSLRQAYTVALEFSDLLEKKQTRPCFSSYREIANSGISPEEKQEIRQIAENEELSFKEVRKLVKTKSKRKEVEENNSEIKKEIVYHTEEDFLKQIRELFQRHKDLESGTVITLKFTK